MMHPHSKSNVYLQKGFLDEVASQTTSTVTYRLTRKQDESSASRRSSKNSSDSSFDGINISKFYVKMTPKEERVSQPLRGTAIKRTNETDRLKRRSPTPAHNRRGKPEQTKRDQNEQMENDIMMADLQRRLNQQKRTKEIFEKRAAAFEKQIKAKLKKIDQLEKRNADLTEKEQTTSKKLQEFQQIAEINESNLNEAKNSLEKLRNIIKKNRCQELELQNNKLRIQNTTILYELGNVNTQNQKQKEAIARLEESLMILRRENEDLTKGSQLREKNLEIEKLKQALAASKSQKEEELERLIKEKSEAEMRQRLRAEKLEIQVAYLNRKKNQEIEHLKLKHLQLIGKMRAKMCILREQYNDLREQHQKLRIKGPNVQAPRRSLLLSDHRPNDDFFLFDLSP